MRLTAALTCTTSARSDTWMAAPETRLPIQLRGRIESVRSLILTTIVASLIRGTMVDMPQDLVAEVDEVEAMVALSKAMEADILAMVTSSEPDMVAMATSMEADMLAMTTSLEPDMVAMVKSLETGMVAMTKSMEPDTVAMATSMEVDMMAMT